MTINIEGKVAYVKGDWTMKKLSKDKIDSLAFALQQIESGGGRALHVDCRHVSATDPSGLQLLHVWMQCARLRGIEPELINVPDNLLHPIMRYSAHDLPIPSENHKY